METKLKVVQLLPLESGVSNTGKQWQRLKVICETEGNYPKKLVVTASKNDIIQAFQNINTSDVIDVSINLESLEYNGRWYTEVSVWKMSLTR